MNNAKNAVALVTGASSGIGQVTAKALVTAGYRVFGTSRKPATSTPGVTMLVCDVTDETSVQTLIQEIVKQAGRIDLVVNNAGIGLIGAAEDSSIAQAQRLFDVNVFGVARVVNAVLPIMRAQRNGRIINMSSILGLIPSPFNAYYASTKHAIEGYTESLDHEVRALGIRALLVEPGVTRTAFEENLTRADQPLPVYATERARSETLMRKWVESGDLPQVVADTVVKAATATKPKLRYSAGKQSTQVSTLRRFMPERMVDSTLRKFNEFPA
ncbi:MULTISPECIES: oxidoreductase [Xanthomonas]|uniref:oxidoreductase n=1 Tax=Xanthomonas TaxID=338 RepID=UPI000E1E6829|nr:MULTISPECIES: oxidoreductase [Xanthomonas]